MSSITIITVVSVRENCSKNKLFWATRFVLCNTLLLWTFSIAFQVGQWIYLSTIVIVRIDLFTNDTCNAMLSEQIQFRCNVCCRKVVNNCCFHCWTFIRVELFSLLIKVEGGQIISSGQCQLTLRHLCHCADITDINQLIVSHLNNAGHIISSALVHH